jgi:hypothetical protein
MVNFHVRFGCEHGLGYAFLKILYLGTHSAASLHSTPRNATVKMRFRKSDFYDEILCEKTFFAKKRKHKTIFLQRKHKNIFFKRKTETFFAQKDKNIFCKERTKTFFVRKAQKHFFVQIAQKNFLYRKPK